MAVFIIVLEILWMCGCQKSFDEATNEVNNRKSIIFIGNSLTSIGCMPFHLEYMLGDDYTVTDACVDGSCLEEHYEWFSNDSYEFRNALETADIVVFQDYGGFTDTTEKSIRKIQAICKDNAEFYFLMTEFCCSADYIDQNCIQMIDSLGNISAIPSGIITDFVCNEYFDGEHFIMEDGYHPTILNGYFMALTFVKEVYETDNVNDVWQITLGNYSSQIPGDTDAEKAAFMKDAQNAAFDKYDEVKIRYKGVLRL